MRILQIKNPLTNIKKYGRSVEAYIMELTKLAEEVRDAGVALDDGELTLIMLNGLDDSYEGFVTAQLARADDMTFAAFQGLLQTQEERYVRSTAAASVSMANSISVTW